MCMLGLTTQTMSYIHFPHSYMDLQYAIYVDQQYNSDSVVGKREDLILKHMNILIQSEATLMHVFAKNETFLGDLALTIDIKKHAQIAYSFLLPMNTNSN